ncbi:putative low complexity protein [Cryptosporidium felis]|nr:putative low complexity protein [Cryptosporidium felis]
MNDIQKSQKKLGPKFKSAKLLNRPNKVVNKQGELDSEKRDECVLQSKKFNPINGILRTKHKDVPEAPQDCNVKPPPSDIAVFGNSQIYGSISGLNSAIPESLLSDALKNNRVKLPGFLDLPGKLGENQDKGIPGLTPGVSSEYGRIHDNLDRLKNEFCRFIDFKYNASTIGNTDLDRRIFLRNSFEKLKEVDYPTIKMQQWNEYQNMLLEQKKNLLLFQKSRGGDQPLDDAWCQTDKYSFDEFVNANIKLKFDNLRKIKAKRMALKKRLYLKGYFDITDFDDIEQIYDDKLLSTLGLDNQFINDSSEDELDDIMDYVEKIDSNGRIEYNNYQIRQILSVFDRKFKRKCKPDYYNFFFGHLDYEKEKLDRKRNLYMLNESERIPKELKLKLVDFLDKKLNWTEIEIPWEWERDFAVDEMNPPKKNIPKINLSDMDSSLLKKGVPNEFLRELTEIRKEYRRELLDNSLKIHEMNGVSTDILSDISINKEKMKKEIYGNVANAKIDDSINKIQKKGGGTTLNTNLNHLIETDKTNRVRFADKPEVFNQENGEQTYSIVVEREDFEAKPTSNLIREFKNPPRDVKLRETEIVEGHKKINDEIAINLSRLILTKGISDELREDLSKHLNIIMNRSTEKQEEDNLHNYQKSVVQMKNSIGSGANIIKAKSVSSYIKQSTVSHVSDNASQGKCLSSKKIIDSDQTNKEESTIEINELESQLETLRNAAGILDILKKLEQDSNLVNNHERLRKLLIKKIDYNEYDLEQSEVKAIEDGVEGIIKEILERRNKQKKPENKEINAIQPPET